MKRFTIVCLVAMNLLCLDLVTKQLAAARLKRSAAVSVIDGFFGLAYVENRGCAWGMFQHHVWPLALFGFLALGFIVWKRDSLFGGGRLEAFAAACAISYFFSGYSSLYPNQHFLYLKERAELRN